MRVESYRRLLGVLFLWVLLPFPFLYIVTPPFWLAAAAVGLLMTLRPSLKLQSSGIVLNLIGVAIIVAVVAAGGIRVGPLRPLGHLLLLLTSVRVMVVMDRRSFLRAVLLVFLVWVVAITTSTHVIVALYFGASAVLWWWVGIRVHFAGLGFAQEAVFSLPRPRHVVAAAILALLVSVPIFMALPRIRSPWISGRGGVSSVTGFSSHVDLAGVGTIRQSREVAMIVRSVSGEAIRSEWIRLRATALQRVTLNSWAPRGAFQEPDAPGGVVRLHGEARRLSETVELEVELIRPRRYLFLPEGTVALSSPISVRMDPTGGVALAQRVRGPLKYTVWVARENPPRAADPPFEGSPRFELDPEVQNLAKSIIDGVGSDAGRASAIESYLQQNYGYSMAGMIHQRADPVSWFLLHERQGHCEYFAGAMAALLNDLGIPARMVTGYSGGRLSIDEKEAVIRQANAHAWVEAWVGADDRWTIFDPTPEADIPTLSRPSGRDHFRWAVDWVQASWDRYILTFGFGEQVQLVAAMANGIDTLLRQISWQILPAVLVIGALAVVGWWAARHRRSSSLHSGHVWTGPAAVAVERIVRKLERFGVEVPPRATIRWIARRARDIWPAAGSAIGELAWLAEREIYAGGRLKFSNRSTVRALWMQTKQGMRN